MVVTLQVKKAGGKLVTVAQPGQVLFPGTLIARLEDQNDGASAKPVDFAGTIEEWHAATERQQRAAAAQRVNLKFGALLQSCNDVLSGYAVPEPFFKDYVQKLVDDLFEVLNDKVRYVEAIDNSELLVSLLSKQVQEGPDPSNK